MDEFRVKIDASIKKAKSCVSDAKRDDEEMYRDKESTAMEMDGRIYYLLGGGRYLGQISRLDDRKRCEARDRSESLVRQVGEVKGMLIEARERYSNVMDNAVGWLNKYMTNMWGRYGEGLVGGMYCQGHPCVHQI